MPLHGFSLRFRRLAFWLSLLALGSALLAPASVLAQQLQSGQWIALCGSGSAQPDDHAGGEVGHCSPCSLPALALPPDAPSLTLLAPRAPAVATLPAAAPVAAPALASIRGPPVLS